MRALIWEQPALCSAPGIKEIKFIHVKKEVMIKMTFQKNLSALSGSLCSV